MAKRWTETEDKFIRKMRDAGEGYREIGYHLDRTAQAVQQRAFKLGISKKRSDSLPIDEPVITHEEMYVTKPKPAWWSAMMWWRK